MVIKTKRERTMHTASAIYFDVDPMALPVEHIVLQTCHAGGCESMASPGDRFCGRCRDELDDLYEQGCLPYYPREI
jgi:hypothetical protein